MQFIFNSNNTLWSRERFLANSISFGTDDNGKEFSTTKEITYPSKWCLRSTRLTTGLLLFHKAGHFEDMWTFSAILYGKLQSFDFGEHLLNLDDDDGWLHDRGKQVVWWWSSLLRRWWGDFLHVLKCLSYQNFHNLQACYNILKMLDH